MNKFMTGLMAVVFVAGLGVAAPSFAGKHMGEAVEKACKDKKAGDKVMVDGKEVVCPEMKKENQ